MSKQTRAPGGGRKSLSAAEKTTSRNVTLLPSQVAELQRLGGGNLSAGIRRMYQMTHQPASITEVWLQQWIDANRPDLGLLATNGVKGFYKLDAGPAHSFQGVGKTWRQVAAHLEAVDVPDAE